MSTNHGQLTTFCAKVLAELENAQRASMNTHWEGHDQSGRDPSGGRSTLEGPLIRVTETLVSAKQPISWHHLGTQKDPSRDRYDNLIRSNPGLKYPQMRPHRTPYRVARCDSRRADCYRIQRARRRLHLEVRPPD